MELGNFSAAAAVNHVSIQRIRSHVAVFNHTYWMPIPESDLTIIAPARDADRPTLLLARAHPGGQRRIRDRVIKLCRRLVVPGTPRRAPVDRDDRPLIAHQKDDVPILGINP